MGGQSRRGRAAAIGSTFALAAAVSFAIGCGGDDTTPDCSSPEAGCGTVLGDEVAPVDSSLPEDAGPDTSISTPDANVPDTNQPDTNDSSVLDAHDASDAHDAHDAKG